MFAASIGGAGEVTVSRLLSVVDHCIASGRSLAVACGIHACLLKTALAGHTLLANRLVDLYAKCGDLSAARAAFRDLPTKNHHSYNTLLGALSRNGRINECRVLFDAMPDRNLVSYNTMISSLAHHGRHREALDIFLEMRKDFVIDTFTVVGVAIAVANLGALRLFRQLHNSVVVSGLEINTIIANVMIDAYGKCGDANSGRNVFNFMVVRDVISWTSLIGVYALNNRLADACEVFDKMPERNVVSWTALISGCEQNGEEEMALEFFKQMIGEGFCPSPFTLVSVLSASASLGLIALGKQLHGFIIRRCIGLASLNIFTSNALIDLYAKCGDMKVATVLFDLMPEKDIVTWNSMVTGFAQNGRGKESLAMFERMMRENIKPNHVTFLGVLSGCSHAGIVSKAYDILDLMKNEYDIKPRPEHYAVFIDALGRNCKFAEAMEFIESLTSENGLACAGMWGALLGACRMHGNLELAKRAAETLFMLEPENGARYVMLSNIYSAAGQWSDARLVRRLMKGKGLRKDPGCSWIEVRSVKHIFIAEDKTHFQTEEIYGLLCVLINQMKKEVEYEEYVHFEFGNDITESLVFV